MRGQIEGFLAEAKARAEAGAPGEDEALGDEGALRDGSGALPKALIAPHAGTIYSGPVAASGYARLVTRAAQIRRVVLLGPSHRVPLRGIGVPSVDAFETPLGEIPLDRETLDSLLELPQVAVSDEAHGQEHSLEVQLPFLQLVLEDFVLLPLVVGRASAEDVAEVIERCWGGPETLIVVSSDLSHYHDYATAHQLDTETSGWIERLELERLSGERACGYHPVRGLLLAARNRGMRAKMIDLRSSGDTAGTRREVVGYATFLLS